MDILKSKFKKEIIDSPNYNKRLQDELLLFQDLNYIDFLLRIVDIYDNYIYQYPNLLRGSSASSLVLYYLGLNHIDPVKYNIPFTRFLNNSRKTFPDIDIDIPFSKRDIIMKQILENNNDTIRMSNNMNHENNIYFDDLIKEDPTLNNCHNSGLVIYDFTQKQIIDENKINDIQIKLTKNNINDYGLKKIDLLTNTGLEQLYNIDNNFKLQDYNYDDENIFQFIHKDNGIGITFAETPAIQRVIKILKPNNIEELSICLA